MHEIIILVGESHCGRALVTFKGSTFILQTHGFANRARLEGEFTSGMGPDGGLAQF